MTELVGWPNNKFRPGWLDTHRGLLRTGEFRLVILVRFQAARAGVLSLPGIQSEGSPEGIFLTCACISLVYLNAVYLKQSDKWPFISTDICFCECFTN